jgi:hypothetical protein
MDHPTRLLGLISALGVGTGCNNPCEQSFDPPPEPDPSASEPPQVIAGEWIGPGVLELEFSKPLAASGQLDPNRFAIVGWYVDGDSFYGQCEPATRYRELMVGYYGTAISDAWIGPEDDTLLRLRLSNSGAQCQIFGSNPVASGVMLAYTNVTNEPAGAQLLDENGNPVPDIGPAWAIMQLDSCFGDTYCGYVSSYQGGQLSQLDTLVQIPCP